MYPGYHPEPQSPMHLKFLHLRYIRILKIHNKYHQGTKLLLSQYPRSVRLPQQKSCSICQQIAA